MPTDATAAALPAAPTQSATPGWLREPLLHFLLLGAVLFGADHVLVSRAGDPHVIEIDAKIDNEARQVFKDTRGREPDEQELYALRRIWTDNEVLYREGLQMELDKGDKAIRERVIFKALSVIDANTRLPKIDDATLRKWFEAHRVKYDEPARFNFEEAVPSGERSEVALRSFAAALNSGAPANTQAGLRVFKDRPRANLEQSYGTEFTRALEAAPVGEWQVLPTRDGLRIMRLESIAPPKPGDFESLRGVVMHDWTDATLAEQRSASVRALAKKYTIKTTATGPAAAQAP